MKSALINSVPVRRPELVLSEGDLETPIIKVVDKMFEIAAASRASDIHLEPHPHALYMRIRVDGMLRTIHEFPRSANAAIVSRIKILAALDITERRLPQDGQIGIHVQGKDIDLRVSTLPGKNGEKVVIRLLDKTVAAMDLGKLGMDPITQSRFEILIAQAQGMILVTGPTGSGKSTTLYSVLERVRSPEKNIITLEDPIEYELKADHAHQAGVTQVQVNSKIGLTFASGLRACLRQDPNVIMLGEIRDQETAEIGMKAAMTGHLVLSTLHTNSAVETIGRLRDIGIEPYLIASTLIGVMAQRLVRVLCPYCKEAYKIPARALKITLSDNSTSSHLTLYRPKGCEQCLGSGYRGRHGIYELLVMNEEIRGLIHRNALGKEMKTLAQTEGLKTLRESGLALVLRGLTTVEEVYRNTVE